MKTTFWVVMKAQPFSAITVPQFANRPLNPPDEGPQRFIPVFNTKEQAEKFDNGEGNVREVSTVE